MDIIHNLSHVWFKLGGVVFTNWRTQNEVRWTQKVEDDQLQKAVRQTQNVKTRPTGERRTKYDEHRTQYDEGRMSKKINWRT